MDFSVLRILDSEPVSTVWRELYAAGGERSIFLSPAWIETWLAFHPDKTDVYFLSGSRRGEILIAGFFGMKRTPSLAVIGERAVRLNESGDASLNAIYVEYNDFLLAPETPESAREEAISAVIREIEADAFVLRNARRKVVAAAQRAAIANNLTPRILNAQPTFQTALENIAPDTDYLASLSATARSQIRRSMRRYEERGPLTVSIAATNEERAAAWESLLYLHGDGWRRRGKAGVFENKALCDFHLALMKTAPEKTQLVECRAGDTLIGCLYNLVEGERVSNYQSGFRFEDDNQLKPGLVTHALAIEHYAKEGYDYYDFLGGDAPYKRRLAMEGEQLTTIVLEKKSGARAQFRNAARRARDLLRSAGTRRT